MKRSILLSITAAAWLAGPAAMAGNDIVKCVDAQGHVTITDQPCTDGASTVRMERATAANGPNAAADTDAAPVPQRHVVPAAELRHPAWQAPAPERAAPLSRDVATLKAARRALLLMDAPRTSLAGLQ